MYGTIARLRLKPGVEARLETLQQEFAQARVPGAIATYAYRMDRDPDEYYLAVVFESKEAYLANAGSPEQHARYLKLRDLLASDPEWNDGEIVHVSQPGRPG